MTGLCSTMNPAESRCHQHILGISERTSISFVAEKMVTWNPVSTLQGYAGVQHVSEPAEWSRRMKWIWNLSVVSRCWCLEPCGVWDFQPPAFTWPVEEQLRHLVPASWWSTWVWFPTAVERDSSWFPRELAWWRSLGFSSPNFGSKIYRKKCSKLGLEQMWFMWCHPLALNTSFCFQGILGSVWPVFWVVETIIWLVVYWFFQPYLGMMAWPGYFLGWHRATNHQPVTGFRLLGAGRWQEGMARQSGYDRHITIFSPEVL